MGVQEKIDRSPCSVRPRLPASRPRTAGIRNEAWFIFTLLHCWYAVFEHTAFSLTVCLQPIITADFLLGSLLSTLSVRSVKHMWPVAKQLTTKEDTSEAIYHCLDLASQELMLTCFFFWQNKWQSARID